MNERERLFQQFDRVQKLENPICLTLGGVVLVFVRVYKLFAGPVLEGPSWIIPVIAVPLLAKFVFALLSARIAGKLRALPAAESIRSATPDA